MGPPLPEPVTAKDVCLTQIIAGPAVHLVSDMNVESPLG
jgi:hypothetical protein